MKFSRVLFEGTKPAPEAPEDEEFGSYLFPQRRGLDRDGVKEPNTPRENSFLAALTSFMGSDNNAESLSKWTETIKKLMAKHEYSQVLEPGHHTV